MTTCCWPLGRVSVSHTCSMYDSGTFISTADAHRPYGHLTSVSSFKFEGSSLSVPACLTPLSSHIAHSFPTHSPSRPLRPCIHSERLKVIIPTGSTKSFLWSHPHITEYAFLGRAQPGLVTMVSPLSLSRAAARLSYPAQASQVLTHIPPSIPSRAFIDPLLSLLPSSSRSPRHPKIA